MAAGFGSQEPSIAAVVGSMDAAIAQYAAQVALQPHRLEVIQVSPFPLYLAWSQTSACSHVRIE